MFSPTLRDGCLYHLSEGCVTPVPEHQRLAAFKENVSLALINTCDTRGLGFLSK